MSYVVAKSTWSHMESRKNVVNKLGIEIHSKCVFCVNTSKVVAILMIMINWWTGQIETYKIRILYFHFQNIGLLTCFLMMSLFWWPVDNKWHFWLLLIADGSAASSIRCNQHGRPTLTPVGAWWNSSGLHEHSCTFRFGDTVSMIYLF